MANLMRRFLVPTKLRRYPLVGVPPLGKTHPSTYQTVACGDVTLTRLLIYLRYEKEAAGENRIDITGEYIQ